MFYRADNGFRNGVLRYQVELIVLESQAQAEMPFNRLDVAIEDATEIGNLLRGKIRQTNRTLDNLASGCHSIPNFTGKYHAPSKNKSE